MYHPDSTACQAFAIAAAAACSAALDVASRHCTLTRASTAGTSGCRARRRDKSNASLQLPPPTLTGDPPSASSCSSSYSSGRRHLYDNCLSGWMRKEDGRERGLRRCQALVGGERREMLTQHLPLALSLSLSLHLIQF